jgi:hypothetical protein
VLLYLAHCGLGHKRLFARASRGFGFLTWEAYEMPSPVFSPSTLDINVTKSVHSTL